MHRQLQKTSSLLSSAAVTTYFILSIKMLYKVLKVKFFFGTETMSGSPNKALFELL